MTKLFYYFAICGVIAFTSPIFGFAHGLGITQQKSVGDYIIEFEYDAISSVVAGQPVSYTIELLNKLVGSRVPYERLWLKVSREGSSQQSFSANLLPVDVSGEKSSQANFILAESGPYTADLIFYGNSQELARASVPFTVETAEQNIPKIQPEKSKSTRVLLAGGLVLIVSIGTVWFFKKRKY